MNLYLSPSTTLPLAWTFQYRSLSSAKTSLLLTEVFWNGKALSWTASSIAFPSEMPWACRRKETENVKRNNPREENGKNDGKNMLVSFQMQYEMKKWSLLSLLCDQWRIHISPFRTWQMFLKIELFFSFCDDISKWWKYVQNDRVADWNSISLLFHLSSSSHHLSFVVATIQVWDRTISFTDTYFFTLMLCSSSTLNVSCMSLIFNSTLKFVDWMAWIVPITTLKSDRTRMFRSRFSRCCYARWI